MIIAWLYTSFSAFALAFNLLSLFISSVVIMTGPGMALRGPEGSVGMAVRHMEQQLKRALRFFGRGIIAFVLSLTVSGLRELRTTGFVGGVCSVLIGLWTFKSVMRYGSDIAEKFHISQDRAVRGVFHKFADGSVRWKNTAAEVSADHRSKAGGIGWFGTRRRWRPPGHSLITPVWRMDKMIAFPYHDEQKLLEDMLSASQKRRHDGDSAKHAREGAMHANQVQDLIRGTQGPVCSSASGLADGSSGRSFRESGSDGIGGGFDPMSALKLVAEALTGNPATGGDGRGQREQKGASAVGASADRARDGKSAPPSRAQKRGEQSAAGADAPPTVRFAGDDAAAAAATDEAAAAERRGWFGLGGGADSSKLLPHGSTEHEMTSTPSRV